MFKIKGTLVRIVSVPEKITEKYTTPAHQVLQVLAELPNGKLDLMDIKDKESVYKKEMEGKTIDVDITVFSPSDIYFSVAAA